MLHCSSGPYLNSLNECKGKLLETACLLQHATNPNVSASINGLVFTDTTSPLHHVHCVDVCS